MDEEDLEDLERDYSKVSFCDGLFYDDSLLQPLSSRTEHTQLVVYHYRNSSALSLLSALTALFRCACISCFCILVQFFWIDCDFSHPWHPPKRRKRKKKQLMWHSFLMSSEQRPKWFDWFFFFNYVCNFLYT